MLGAGFAFCGNIDLSEEVRANCISKTKLLSFFCFFFARTLDSPGGMNLLGREKRKKPFSPSL
ncbi:MAG TPA: hypothetical protein PKY59_26705, partial [Pyrinomonadaceae bacterium]|nr:hypothetical protein [Pyrinomonadaceae bacterium]